MIVFTSDDSVANALNRTDPDLAVWAWSESLHMGSVERDYDLDAFAKRRAASFRDWGWDECVEVEADWTLRNDALMQGLAEGQEIGLLFGKGVRDQLPLARICGWLAAKANHALDKVRLLNVDSSLTDRSDQWLSKAVSSAPPAGIEAIRQYERVWEAFVSSDPKQLEGCWRSFGDGPLQEALERLLREFPSSENGLSLTECQILDALSLGIRSPRELFDRFSETEDPPFLNDWEFWLILERMATGASPLIELGDQENFLRPPNVMAWNAFHDQTLGLTQTGESVLKGSGNYAALDFQERWIGGCRVAKDNFWFWDYEARELARTTPLASAP